MEQLPIPIPITISMLKQEYSKDVMEVACPVCVCDGINQQQIRKLNSTL